MREAAARLARYYENPVQFAVEECKFEPDSRQREFLSVLPSQRPNEKQQALKACTGAGKSGVISIANLWFTALHEHSRAAVVSIDGANLRSGVWAEMAKWQQRSEWLKREFVWTSQRFHHRNHKATWWIEAREWAKKADPESQGRALSGLHEWAVMATLDEAGDIPPPLLRVAQQIFSSAHQYAKILIGGNPTSLSGVLYQVCVVEAHRTHVITVSGDPDDPDCGARVNKEMNREAIELYGRDNPWVMATILGKFPPASINTLLGIEEVETAMKRAPREDAFAWAQKRLGVDCARFGDDRTALCPRQGVMWLQPTPMRGARTDAIAGRVITAVNAWEPQDPKSILIMIDQTGGWGQGTVDQLMVAGYSPLEFVYSTPATMSKYYNIRAQGWMEMANHVRRAAALPNMPDLKRELTAPTYTLKDGRLMVEPKELLKARLGFSPDLGDGYANTYMLPDMPKLSSEARARRGNPNRGDFDPYRDSA